MGYQKIHQNETNHFQDSDTPIKPGRAYKTREEKRQKEAEEEKIAREAYALKEEKRARKEIEEHKAKEFRKTKEIEEAYKEKEREEKEIEEAYKEKEREEIEKAYKEKEAHIRDDEIVRKEKERVERARKEREEKTLKETERIKKEEKIARELYEKERVRAETVKERGKRDREIYQQSLAERKRKQKWLIMFGISVSVPILISLIIFVHNRPSNNTKLQLAQDDERQWRAHGFEFNISTERWEKKDFQSTAFNQHNLIVNSSRLTQNELITKRDEILNEVPQEFRADILDTASGQVMSMKPDTDEWFLQIFKDLVANFKESHKQEQEPKIDIQYPPIEQKNASYPLIKNTTDEDYHSTYSPYLAKQELIIRRNKLLNELPREARGKIIGEACKKISYLQPKNYEDVIAIWEELVTNYKESQKLRKNQEDITKTSKTKVTSKPVFNFSLYASNWNEPTHKSSRPLIRR